jgi:hypothetical protein
LADGRTALSQHRRRTVSTSGPGRGGAQKPRKGGEGHPRGGGDRLVANDWLFGGEDWLVSGDDWLLSGDDRPSEQTLRNGNGGQRNGNGGQRNGNGGQRNGNGRPRVADVPPSGERGPAEGDDTRFHRGDSLPRGADGPDSRSAKAPNVGAMPRSRDASRHGGNTRPSSSDTRPPSGAGARRGRRSRRSVRAFLLTTVVAAILVAGGAEYMIGEFSPQPSPLAEALTAIPSSKAGMKLMHQRQHMILMAAATKTFKVVGKPKVATKPAPPSGGGGGGGAPIVNVPIPSPGTAQHIAYTMLPSFGFNAKQQFGCLDSIWSRESGWRVTAANASGAYGIPQALPGSKMASAGPDWQTNATTQIKWGLGYIKDRYGSPCNAWAFWQGHGWY